MNFGRCLVILGVYRKKILQKKKDLVRVSVGFGLLWSILGYIFWVFTVKIIHFKGKKYLVHEFWSILGFTSWEFIVKKYLKIEKIPGNEFRSILGYNPFRAPKSLPILIPNKHVPEKGFQSK